MRVDGDALALGLLQQSLEIEQVVPGDQDGLACFDAEGDLGGHRDAEGDGVGFVQKLHGLVVGLATAKSLGYPVR